MADSKITALTATTTLADTDIFPVVTDPSGTPVTKKITLENLRLWLSGTGWISANETWTYASATTFTISGDKTTKYQKGDKVKLTQPTLGVKYFYITAVSYSSPNTTVTVTGGTDYTLASEGITSPNYSKCSTPQGFPHWFNFTPVWTNITVGDGTQSAKFMLNGYLCQIEISFTLGSTSSVGTTPHFTLPITSNSVGVWAVVLKDTGVNNHIGMGQAVGAECYPYKVNVGATLTYSGVTATTPFTWATGDVLQVSGIYGI